MCTKLTPKISHHTWQVPLPRGHFTSLWNVVILGRMSPSLSWLFTHQSDHLWTRVLSLKVILRIFFCLFSSLPFQQRYPQQMSFCAHGSKFPRPNSEHVEPDFARRYQQILQSSNEQWLPEDLGVSSPTFAAARVLKTLSNPLYRMLDNYLNLNLPGNHWTYVYWLLPIQESS